jgi:hypothetical protein
MLALFVFVAPLMPEIAADPRLLPVSAVFQARNSSISIA